MLKSGTTRAAAWVVAALVVLLSAGRVAAEESHVVGRGETLSSIAGIYAVTVEAVADLNGIADPDQIFEGDVLQIPGKAADEPRREPVLHSVQDGDTLWALADRYGVDVSAIQEANGLDSPDFIMAGQSLLIPPEAGMDPLAGLPPEPPSDGRLEAIIDEFAAAEGLDPGMVRSVAYVESGWDQQAVSPAGAIGVMQLMPDTASWLEQQVFGHALNEDMSVYDNVKAGTRFMKMLVDWNGGDVNTALASYYQGQGATAAGKMYADTVGYVRYVRGVWERYWR